MARHEISVIFPTYNERGNIKELLAETKAALTKIGTTYEILVVDDNSPDGTSDAVRTIMKKEKHVHLLHRKNKRGLATAIRDGIERTDGNTIIIFDTDLSQHPRYIPSLYRKMQQTNADMVVASRYLPKGDMEGNAYRHTLSAMLNRALRMILGIKLTDLTGGFFIIKRDSLSAIDLQTSFVGYGDYFFTMTYNLKKAGRDNFQEIPYVYEPRKYGQSKTKVLRVGIAYLTTALRIRFT